MTGAFVCFLDSYLLFFLFGLSNSLRIRGYLIKYPRIFHHVSVDISLRIHGYAKFLLCLRGLLVAWGWFFSYCCFCFYSHKSHRSHEIFFHRCFLFHAKRSSPPEGAKGNLATNAKISFIAGFLVSHRSHESHESIHRLRSYVPSGWEHSAKPTSAGEATRHLWDSWDLCETNS